MIYRISHKTTYKYKDQVSLGNHVACLTPRNFPHHRCIWTDLRIEPLPTTHSERTDFFGNRIDLFTIKEPHKQLVVEARSEVVMDDHEPWSTVSIPWEKAIRRVPHNYSADGLNAYQFVFESPRIRHGRSFAEYALASFSPGREFGAALRELTTRIHRDFRFDAKATNVRTTPEDVFRKKRGVCQDFAHVQIACLRSIGVPARYVSGYLRTYPAPGRPRLIGADVSHAWVSAYCPDTGWLDVDPTNDLVPLQSHVTVAWGRDYGDISPLRGLILGGGRDHSLKVNVDMEPLE
jgi:transglutaminase-like putative cysteine protease